MVPRAGPARPRPGGGHPAGPRADGGDYSPRMTRRSLGTRSASARSAPWPVGR
jgi:hypothetical protein